MDSGLGSDDDRKGRTKEQKQLRNQQLLSGCFIDAASLSDDAEVPDRRNDERRQGALLFQSSIPQFSMLQMTAATSNGGGDTTATPAVYPETPYNSIVHLETTNGDDGSETASTKSPMGFYVDLNDVPDPPKTPPNTSATKNIFSLVIDFEGPKKEKPSKLGSSLVTYKKNKQTKHLTATSRFGGSSSLSSSVSSISSVAGPSSGANRQEDDEKDSGEIEIKNSNCSLKSSTSSENENGLFKYKHEEVVVDGNEEENAQEIRDVGLNNDPKKQNQEEKKDNNQERPQFVKLSDLECQKPRVDLNFTTRMSKSIPESSWVESPLLMSRSAGYRSAPHPLEPESEELSDSGSFTTTDTTTASQPKRSVRRLGTDLLRMFLEEIGPDVTVEVDGHRLKAHKCILASRCQYFAAILSGNWLEASGNVISLQGFSYESVYFALCHIYSGAAHVPDSISLVELSSLADMLGLEGLKEVVEHALKQRHCHNFHKPCAGCCSGVLEVLPLSAAYGLDDLYQKCLQWITQHFVRVWPSRAFATLPRELREKCYQQHVVHMTADKVLETIVNCDKIMTTLPSLRWAEPVTQLVLQLADACHLYHRQHFAAVLSSPSFAALDVGLGWGVGQVEEQLLSAASNLGVEQACRSYARCCKMCEQNWSRPVNDLLYKIKVQLEQCLVAQSDRLIRSNAWLRLDTALRCRIKDLTPLNESTSRLPKRVKNMSTSQMGTSRSHSTTVAAASSSESSRNSSPVINHTSRLQNSSGSPSLRRSLLLAAKAPQVPPSPSTNRRISTLTQPTASSAAKSASTKNMKPITPKKVAPKSAPTNQKNQNQIKQIPLQRKPTLRSTNANTNVTRKPLSNNTNVSGKKTDSRTNSPMKRVDVNNKKAGSRIGHDVKKSSSLKTVDSKDVKDEKPATPVMQRSSTFLKDEPTVMGKML